MNHRLPDLRTDKAILALLCLIGLSGCASVTPSENLKTTTYTAELHEIPAGDCRVHTRRIGNPGQPRGPLFVTVNGVPTTALIYQGLGEALVKRLSADVLLVDLPGTGDSRLHSGNYSWTTQRECLRAYLAQQPDFTLIVHDVAGPILLPLLDELPQIRSVVVFNTVLKPSEFSPPFPLNCLRSCLFLSKPLAYATPFWFIEYRVRDLGIAHNERVDRATIRAVFDEVHQDGGMGRLVDVMKGFELTREADTAIGKGLAHDIPQLFIWGRSDPALGHELDHLPPGGSQRQVHVFEHAKHYLMLDYAEESAEVIAQWYGR
jgi:pimeloyl-ACP methyl ester carboxylesterase